MELYFNLISLTAGLLFGTLIGLGLGSKFDLFLKVNKKEDYEAKVAELDAIMESLLEEHEEIKAKELFPPDLNKDYGIPRKLK